jgi:hypothetical protein
MEGVGEELRTELFKKVEKQQYHIFKKCVLYSRGAIVGPHDDPKGTFFSSIYNLTFVVKLKLLMDFEFAKTTKPIGS